MIRFHRCRTVTTILTLRVHTACLAASLWLVSALAWGQDPLVAPDCKCRAPDGQMRDLGTVQCVDIVGTRKLVRCEMSTNTPYWKTVDGVEGCPDA
ncbi:MAG: hypothetical protein HKN42_00700 [Granulosicoccus sp.]|nr:hypothetical protein [Granulosicoccus sp.]